MWRDQLRRAEQRRTTVAIAATTKVTTGRDTTTAANNAIVGDDLINTVMALKQQYQASPSLCWVMSRAITSVVRKIKDSQNRYMWEPSLQAGQPWLLLNYPVMMSEYAPSQSGISAGAYAAILGDFSKYCICDVEGEEDGPQIKRLDQLFSLTRQMGFQCERKCDAAHVLEEAFSRLIMHT